MREQVPFIGRQKEIERISELTEQWGTRQIICIHGEGGIGKTRLLQEIHNQYSQPEHVLKKIKGKAVKIALLHEFTASEWSQQFITGARSIAKELGVELIETDACFNFDKMADDLNHIIAESPDVIIIRLGSNEKLRPGIEKAIQQGIRIIAFDNYLPNIEGLSARVMIDYAETALSMLHKLAKDINFRGAIATVWSEHEAMQKERKGILDSFLMKYPDISLVAEFGAIGDNMAEQVYHKTKEVVRNFTLSTLHITV